MTEWTEQRLNQMITDGVEESLSLDYKGSGALAKTDGKKIEITKDVSAFANSSGGLLIYGVAEFNDDARKHLPERLDPIPRTEISKEWLDQIIQSIQPRIEGVVIHPVTISELDNAVCYVVEIPQSHTAHMARDHRYHKRNNSTTVQMEDYEVRDVMNRRTHPRIQASIFVNFRAGGFKPEGVILVKVENIGRVLARHVMVELELPYDMNGLILPDGDDVVCEQNDEGDCYLLRLNQGLRKIPIFPGSYYVFHRKVHTRVRTQHLSGRPIVSARNVKISVFADEMPALRAKLDVAPVLLGWTPLTEQTAP